MDAKEQADRMAAAEALYMISTRGSKGKGDVAIPHRSKSKRGKKSKKSRSELEEGFVRIGANEASPMFEEVVGVGRSRSRSRSNSLLNRPRSKRDRSRSRSSASKLRGQEDETIDTNLATTHQGFSGKGREGNTDRMMSMFDKDERDNDKMEMKQVESGLTDPLAIHAGLELGTQSGRGRGKRGRSRSRGHGIISDHKSKEDSPNVPFTSTKPSPKVRLARGIRRKSPGTSDESESQFSLSTSIDTKPSASSKSKPPPKKLGRFREKSPRAQSNSARAEQTPDEDETKTEIQALGFTGAALTLKPLVKGGRAVFVSQRKSPVSNEVKPKVIQGSTASTTSISSSGSAINSLTSAPGLPSLTSDVMNLPSLPVELVSLQLPSMPVPNLSSISDLKEVKTSSDAQKESDKAQKVLPLKKRKFHSQKQEEERKFAEDGSDAEYEETCNGEPTPSPAPSGASCQAHVQTKFTVQAHPIITMQTLMEINTALTPDEDGDLPLHIAVVHENMRMVTKLINLMKIAVKGVDKFNKQQQTPLHLAVKLDFLPAVALLISSGANVNTVDGTGSSAIHMAVQGGFLRCLEHMLSNASDAEVNARNFEGLSPLHLAVDNNDLEQVRLLLKHGAEIDLADGKSGRTALFHAAETNQKPMVELLLKKGANPDVPNYAGVTTTMAAQGRSLHSILKLIGSVSQEIKWSFVAVKTNHESNSDAGPSNNKTSTPSVEVYAGTSLLHSELMKNRNPTQPDGLGGQSSRLYEKVLVVKSHEEKAKKSTLDRSPPTLQSPPSAADVKKELDGHKLREEPKATSSPLSPHRVKQEVPDSLEATPPSSGAFSQGDQTHERRSAPVATGNSQPTSKEEVGNSGASTSFSHLFPPQPVNDKASTSPSLSRSSSPRTPTASTPDSTRFTSMQARLYKKLLEMYSMDSGVPLASLSGSGLKSLPSFPTQLSPSSSSAHYSTISSSSASISQPASPHAYHALSDPPLLHRSLSNHCESQQQTFLVQRNPVQRISVLPTPRDTLTMASADSMALSPQPLPDPDVPLNLSSKTSGKDALTSTSGSLYPASPGSHALVNSDLSARPPPPLIHHSHHYATHSGSSSGKNGESNPSRLSSSSAVIGGSTSVRKKDLHSNHGASGFAMTDFPHISKSVSPQTASLVRNFLANQPVKSVDPPSSKTPPSSSASPSVSSSHFSAHSSSISTQPHRPSYPVKRPLPSILPSPSPLTFKSGSAGASHGDNPFITLATTPSGVLSIGGQFLEVARRQAVADPKFLHQGRIIDLSQGEESREMAKSKPLLVGRPPLGKVVGFSGAILTFSSPETTGSQDGRTLYKPSAVMETTTKTTAKKRSGRKLGKSSHSSLLEPLETTANKIKHETDRKLKKFLGLKQKEHSDGQVGQGGTEMEVPSSEVNTTRSEVEVPRLDVKMCDVAHPSMNETVGIFSGHPQDVQVKKVPTSQSPSASARQSSTPPPQQPCDDLHNAFSTSSPAMPDQSTVHRTQESWKSSDHAVGRHDLARLSPARSERTGNVQGVEKDSEWLEKAQSCQSDAILTSTPLACSGPKSSTTTTVRHSPTSRQSNPSPTRQPATKGQGHSVLGGHKMGSGNEDADASKRRNEVNEADDEGEQCRDQLDLQSLKKVRNSDTSAPPVKHWPDSWSDGTMAREEANSNSTWSHDGCDKTSGQCDDRDDSHLSRRESQTDDEHNELVIDFGN